MNIEEYISSGILEAYALGELSPVETMEVEKVLARYPEAKQELAKVEETMEAFAMKTAVTPRAVVKEKIMTAASASDSKINTEGKVISMVTETSQPFWRYATAASIVVALITSVMAYHYRTKWIEQETAYNELSSQNQKIAEDYNVVNQKLDKIQGDLAIVENTSFQKVIMKGTPNDVNALASVYWNESSKEVYISVSQLKEIAKENQFQLWAIVDGKPVDAGVFDKGFAGLLKMKNISGASAFAVTIEPKGGKASPTLTTMQVVGAVSAIKS